MERACVRLRQQSTVALWLLVGATACEDSLAPSPRYDAGVPAALGADAATPRTPTEPAADGGGIEATAAIRFAAAGPACDLSPFETWRAMDNSAAPNPARPVAAWVAQRMRVLALADFSVHAFDPCANAWQQTLPAAPMLTSRVLVRAPMPPLRSVPWRARVGPELYEQRPRANFQAPRVATQRAESCASSAWD